MFLFNYKRKNRIKPPTMPCKTEDMLLEGATPAGLVFRWHCGTYLLCRLQNRLWMTAPEYRIYGNRLPVSLGKERTVTICFQPSHTLHDKNKTIKPATNLQEHFFPKNFLGTLCTNTMTTHPGGCTIYKPVI